MGFTGVQTEIAEANIEIGYAGPLADTALAGITKRFTGFLDRSDLIMARITLPQFKRRWLDESGKEQARSL
jgi:hypothetical protein